MSGGIDIRALEVPKRLFGSARAFEEGGSLTVVGTALIETGSRMDDIIFQEFKGTGNMELVLDRKLADRRVYPAMDMTQSGTRKEERILPPDDLKKITLLRRTLVQLKPMQAMESLVQQLGEFPSNAAFLDRIAKRAQLVALEPAYKASNRLDPCQLAKRHFQLGQLVNQRDRVETKYHAWQSLADRFQAATARVKGWKGKKLPYTFGVVDVSCLMYAIDYAGLSRHVNLAQAWRW